MGSNFWRFASTLEKEFHVPYDRDREVVTCPECRSLLVGAELQFEDYTSYTEDGYVVYSCPYCAQTLVCRAVEA